MRNAAEGDRVFVVDEDFEILTCLQMELFPHGAGQNYLALLGEYGRHGVKVLRREAGYANSRRDH